MLIHVKIRLIRLEKGYSQTYMAFCLNISQNSYSRLETGQVELTINRVIAIAEILRVNPLELFEVALQKKT